VQQRASRVAKVRSSSGTQPNFVDPECGDLSIPFDTADSRKARHLRIVPQAIPAQPLRAAPSGARLLRQLSPNNIGRADHGANAVLQNLTRSAADVDLYVQLVTMSIEFAADQADDVHRHQLTTRPSA